MFEVTTAGIRTAEQSFFDNNSFNDGFKHHPALLIVPASDGVHIICATSLATILSEADETVVLRQWPGQWRSDFFHTTVGEIRAQVGA